MSCRAYWLDLFTGKTWREFLEAGATISGFRESRWSTLQKMRPGDYLLCYLTGVSRWIGILEVTSEPFIDKTPIWGEEDFPCRVRVKPLVTLKPETAVPILLMQDDLSIFRSLKNPNAWTGHLRGSPAKWKIADGEAVVKAVSEAQQNPVFRAVNPAKLERSVRSLKASIGMVTVPEDEEGPDEEIVSSSSASDHDKIQWMLLKLGSDFGLDVWVARNDRNRIVNGHRFADLPRMKAELPLQFDEATTRTIELIDVLWLKGNAIVAAFEIECTTSIYSGLLRMADLIAMQPNLKIPLFLVAPDERKDKVISEVNRPTFARLSPPLHEVCKYISFSVLQERIPQVSHYLRYMKHEFVQELAEACVPEE